MAFGQSGAISGRRAPRSRIPQINALAPRLRDLYAQRQAEEFAQEGRKLERKQFGLEKDKLAAQKAFQQQTLAFEQEKMAAQEAQARQGMGLEAAKFGMNMMDQGLTVPKSIGGINIPGIGGMNVGGLLGSGMTGFGLGQMFGGDDPTKRALIGGAAGFGMNMLSGGGDLLSGGISGLLSGLGGLFF